MDSDQLNALTEEFFRDINVAKLQATILNASGNYAKTFSVADLLHTEPEDAAPAMPSTDVREALKRARKEIADGKK